MKKEIQQKEKEELIKAIESKNIIEQCGDSPNCFLVHCSLDDSLWLAKKLLSSTMNLNGELVFFIPDMPPDLQLDDRIKIAKDFLLDRIHKNYNYRKIANKWVKEAIKNGRVVIIKKNNNPPES